MRVPAFYFDGRTSRRRAVCLRVEDGIAIVSGDFSRSCPLRALRISERTRSAPREVRFPDGAYLEVLDNRSFHLLLEASDYRDAPPVRMQRNWRGAGAALAASLAILFAGHHFFLTILTDRLAHALPARLESSLGRDALALLDRGMLAPSELSQERQIAVLNRFSALKLPSRSEPGVEILFRRSRAGANAFALPAGRIVITDQLVLGLENDDELVAVLAHELGHLNERHLLRRMLQGASSGAIMTLLFGEVSAVASSLPTLLLGMEHSRNSEREADDYAVRLLRLNGIDPQALSSALQKLSLQHASGDGPSYLSTHPAMIDRITHIRAYSGGG